MTYSADEIEELVRKWRAAEFNYAKHPSHVTRQRLEMHKANLAAARKPQ
jgi:hypothetical protein